MRALLARVSSSTWLALAPSSLSRACSSASFASLSLIFSAVSACSLPFLTASCLSLPSSRWKLSAETRSSSSSAAAFSFTCICSSMSPVSRSERALMRS